MSKFNSFFEEVKSDKKRRSTFICTLAGLIIALTAITVIFVSHGKVPVASEEKAIETTKMNITTELTTVSTTSAQVSTTEKNSTSATTVAKSQITTQPQSKTKAQVKSQSQTKSPTKAQTAAKTQAVVQSKTQAPAKPTTTKGNSKSEWTQADVNAAVAEAKQYARNRGLIIDSSLTASGTSWMSPIDTRWDAKTRVNKDLHYQIENSLTGISEELIKSGVVTINIFSVKYSNYWEIYVVY